MSDPLPDKTPDPQAFASVDRLVHEPARLAIVSLLSVLESADFLFVMRQTGLTQGNLSSHLSKLEAGGYVDVEKHFEGKRPVTTLRLTQAGRRAFEEYRSTMRTLLQ
ncbi:transcriptional regulator [bacterium]|nr:transcriptional regulator [bacterium]